MLTKDSPNSTQTNKQTYKQSKLTSGIAVTLLSFSTEYMSLLNFRRQTHRSENLKSYLISFPIFKISFEEVIEMYQVLIYSRY